MTDAYDEPIEAPAGHYWDIDLIASELRNAREDWRNAHKRHAEHGAAGFPSRHVVDKIMVALCGALFPLRLGPSFVRQHNEEAFVAETLQTALSRLYGQIRLELGYAIGATSPELVDGEAGRIIGHFAHELPRLRRLIDTDVEAAYASDPAARSVDEVLICYPCVLAIVHHRLAHLLHGLGAPLVARIISEIANSRTGIDIHPGASIGESFFIDHGTGVVIGETAIIGRRVQLYQAVTLGARSFPADADGAIRRGIARHPVVEDDVVIYAGATILGRVTIGAGSTIGGNVWLTTSVPPGSVLSQARAYRATASALLEPMGGEDVA
ncbi:MULTISPECIES: serine O-acetyltransferase EpsC [unclassified Sphingomonas]|uniref:serine O-acetyltransferase EpsC n=1 Tax=unclassified Sphingomonas TaxID=196159 RepID=UPI0006F4014B|nr:MULTISPECIES: serine O-acetyltransferase EpsC [unclassified Sphingomonas]KQX18226.1 serine acetyltransferase [Sphingomonas sp. Root1294]KQY71032.1 serine acetyltransferase [Sphingomonas sp. Root50]KRB91554.1 serine acetyltransferase [Sphingomonas sp. Root720]